MGFFWFEKDNTEESLHNGLNICKRVLQRERSGEGVGDENVFS